MNADRHAAAPAGDGDRTTIAAPAGQGSVHTVHFAFDSIEISRDDVAAISARLPTLEGRRVSVVGYTDATGPVSYNQGLALRRARAVAGLLASKGIAQSAIKTEGRGGCCYLAPNDTAAGRARNRRAELLVGPRAALPLPGTASRSPD